MVSPHPIDAPRSAHARVKPRVSSAGAQPASGSAEWAGCQPVRCARMCRNLPERARMCHARHILQNEPTETLGHSNAARNEPKLGCRGKTHAWRNTAQHGATKTNKFAHAGAERTQIVERGKPG